MMARIASLRKISGTRVGDRPEAPSSAKYEQPQSTILLGRLDSTFGEAGSASDQPLQMERRAAETVPFWIRVCALMLVPTAFLVVYMAISLAGATGNYRFMTDTAPIITLIVNCERALLDERLASSQVLQVARGSTLWQARATALTAKRGTTDAACDALNAAALQSSFAGLQIDYLAELRDQNIALDIVRYEVDVGMAYGSAVRKSYTDIVGAVIDGMSSVMQASALPSQCAVVRELLTALNYLGLCRALGNLVLTAGPIAMTAPTADGDLPPIQQFVANCPDALRRSLADLHAEADSTTLGQLDEWTSSSGAQQVLSIVYGLESIEMENASYLPNITAANYTAVATDVISAFQSMGYSVEERLRQAQSLKDAFEWQLAYICVWLSLSLVGVCVVGRAQRRATTKVDAALAWTDGMARAVQAFIPQDFLRLMEVESILRLERGERSRVRLAMLFCDIRNFTGISERLSNELLFDWLQAHLMRMTRTTERHHGFVDKFIGDAVSSLFQAPGDAVRCAVRMQAVTDALCVELISHNEDQLVRIGVGVHFGEAEVGVLGNDKHLTCVVISSEVNVAAQLESLTKEYGARILITEEVQFELEEGEFQTRPLGEIRMSRERTNGFVVHDVYDADTLEQKQYKASTAALWGGLIQAQQEARLPEVRRLVGLLRTEAEKVELVDPALDVKDAAAGPCDVFELN